MIWEELLPYFNKLICDTPEIKGIKSTIYYEGEAKFKSSPKQTAKDKYAYMSMYDGTPITNWRSVTSKFNNVIVIFNFQIESIVSYILDMDLKECETPKNLKFFVACAYRKKGLGLFPGMNTTETYAYTIAKEVVKLIRKKDV